MGLLPIDSGQSQQAGESYTTGADDGRLLTRKTGEHASRAAEAFPQKGTASQMGGPWATENRNRFEDMSDEKTCFQIPSAGKRHSR
jgi:hypothetical protein